MNSNLFFPVLSVFIVFHLCKAGPLRHLEKRAAFYIANETACVVDNIVYTNGDPIPTDDPCEACRCRPPGFACVLKECKIKPGCRAVRHAGECCPEYICGCEHNGRFYKDGEEIRDAKNPCYECHCQGSSIACAFVDCIYRDECDSVFVPGECCPQYTNCTRDIPDRNLFLGEGNVLPPVNLLPVYNGDSSLTEVITTDQNIELTENPTNPTELQEPNDEADKALTSENNETEDVPSKSETVQPENSETEVKDLNTNVEESDSEPLELSEGENQNLPKETENKETIESIEETKILLNSKSDINRDVTQNSELQTSSFVTETVKELPGTTIGSKLEENVSETEVTEKQSETEPTSTEVTEKDTQIRNSAAENSKSLKLSNIGDLEKTENEHKNIKLHTKIDEETTTELLSKFTSPIPTGILKESPMTESVPQSSENAGEESQTNSQAASYINNVKIKSESAETVTIVVHVKESPKLSTETDFIAESVEPVSKTNVTEENLLKFSDEIERTNSKKESFELEDKISTNTNFEIFPTTKKVSEIVLVSKSPSNDQNIIPTTMKTSEIEVETTAPSIDQNLEDIQVKSDEADNIALEAEENIVTEDSISDSKSVDDTLATTMSATKINKEARTDEEITEKNIVDKSTSTVERLDTSKPITTETITDPSISLKSEEKIEGKEIKNEKMGEIIEGLAPEVREAATELIEKTKETTLAQSTEETTKLEEKFTQAQQTDSVTEKRPSIPEEKLNESTPTNIVDKPQIKTNDEIKTEKVEEKTNTEIIPDKTTEESKSEKTTESQNQVTEETKQTTQSDNQ